MGCKVTRLKHCTHFFHEEFKMELKVSLAFNKAIRLGNLVHFISLKNITSVVGYYRGGIFNRHEKM
jgi:hypothetical protein